MPSADPVACGSDYGYLHASILAGAADGYYHALATRLAERAKREHGSLTVVPTAGSIENVERVTRGSAEAAVGQRFFIHLGRPGEMDEAPRHGPRRGAPYHPMTRWHQALKNRILLENYYLPGDLENQIETFVADYNHRRYHESIDNLSPADVYLDADKPSCWKEKGSSATPSKLARLLHRRQAA
jgi:hypothetical protein